MARGRARTVAVVGLQAIPVGVEAHVGPGLPGLRVIGSSGSAAREAAERVRTALTVIGVPLPNRKALVSLAPADVPKAGARFDLAMAVAVLAELGVVPADELTATALLGELALDGGVRAVPGVLPSAASLPAAGVRRLLVPDGNAAEAAVVDDLDVLPVADLVEVVGVLRRERPARAVHSAEVAASEDGALDLADVRGQPEARRALEIAAAGGHHLLLLGPPGCGKSMLARRLPSILPPLDRAQALEVAAIRSVAGLTVPAAGGSVPLIDHRPPFRAPHHSVSAAALLGGGSGIARPGEVSLALHGVLFLDELLEWPRALLESLREPLEEGVVRVARSKATVVYPARTQLVAAANPCPCGGGDGCDCPDDRIWSYRARLSAALADRLDLAPPVVPLRAADLLSSDANEPSSRIRARVAAARAMARERGTGRNADGSPALLAQTARPPVLRRLARAVERGELTARGYDRALRVARTIADLAGSDVIRSEHVAEARAHRLALRRQRAPLAAGAPR